jgi:hypothetical protein
LTKTAKGFLAQPLLGASQRFSIQPCCLLTLSIKFSPSGMSWTLESGKAKEKEKKKKEGKKYGNFELSSEINDISSKHHGVRQQ